MMNKLAWAAAALASVGCERVVYVTVPADGGDESAWEADDGSPPADSTGDASDTTAPPVSSVEELLERLYGAGSEEDLAAAVLEMDRFLGLGGFVTPELASQVAEAQMALRSLPAGTPFPTASAVLGSYDTAVLEVARARTGHRYRVALSDDLLASHIEASFADPTRSEASLLRVLVAGGARLPPGPPLMGSDTPVDAVQATLLAYLYAARTAPAASPGESPAPPPPGDAAKEDPLAGTWWLTDKICDPCDWGGVWLVGEYLCEYACYCQVWGEVARGFLYWYLQGVKFGAAIAETREWVGWVELVANVLQQVLLGDNPPDWDSVGRALAEALVDFVGVDAELIEITQRMYEISENAGDLVARCEDEYCDGDSVCVGSSLESWSRATPGFYHAGDTIPGDMGTWRVYSGVGGGLYGLCSGDDSPCGVLGPCVEVLPNADGSRGAGVVLHECHRAVHCDLTWEPCDGDGWVALFLESPHDASMREFGEWLGDFADCFEPALATQSGAVVGPGQATFRFSLEREGDVLYHDTTFRHVVDMQEQFVFDSLASFGRYVTYVAVVSDVWDASGGPYVSNMQVDWIGVSVEERLDGTGASLCYPE